MPNTGTVTELRPQQKKTPGVELYGILHRKLNSQLTELRPYYTEDRKGIDETSWAENVTRARAGVTGIQGFRNQIAWATKELEACKKILQANEG